MSQPFFSGPKSSILYLKCKLVVGVYQSKELFQGEKAVHFD